MKQSHTLAGIHYLIDGYAMLLRPGLRRFLWVPIIVSFIILMALFYCLAVYFGHFDSWFASKVPSWLAWLSILFWLVFFLGFFIVFISGFTVLMTMVAAPFNSLLAEKTELMLTGQPLPQTGIFANAKDIPRLMWRQGQIIAYYLPRALGLLLLFFIPIVNILAPIGWFLFNAWFLSLQFLDFPTDNHHIPIYEVRRVMSSHFLLVLTFGVGVLIALMIPIINLCTMPAAVIGATKLWLDLEADKCKKV